MNESEIRKSIRNVLMSKRQKLINENKSSKLEDEIDEVWDNPDASAVGDLLLIRSYRNTADAKRLKSKNLKWAERADRLKSSVFGNKKEFERDKKRILNKIQRIDYIVGLVLNPPKKEKQQGLGLSKKNKKGKDPISNSSMQTPEKTPKSTSKSTSKPKNKKKQQKKSSPQKTQIKKIQKIIKAPSSLRDQSDPYGGADGVWGQKTTASWQKYFSDPMILAKAKILYTSNYGSAETSESKSFKKKLILKRSDIAKLIKEVVSESSIDEKSIINNLKTYITKGKEGIGSISILLGYDSDMKGIADMLDAIEELELVTELEQEFTDIEGYIEEGATLKYYKYQGGGESYEKDGNLLSGDEAKSAFKAWKRWSPWNMNEDSDEQLDSSWSEYLDLDSSELTLGDERKYNSYYKCDANDGLGPFVVKYFNNNGKIDNPERWASLGLTDDDVLGERIYEDSKEGPYIFGQEGIITDEDMANYSKWINEISRETEAVAKLVNTVYKNAIKSAEKVWKAAFAEMNETFTDETIVTKACTGSTSWIEGMTISILDIFIDNIFIPEKRFQEIGLIPENVNFLRESEKFKNLVQNIPTQFTVFKQICFNNTTDGYKNHFKGKQITDNNFLAYFKEYGGLESTEEKAAALKFLKAMKDNNIKNELLE